MATHEHYMRLALQLAERGRYCTSPNPMVGCIIVQDDEIIAEGWHQGPGTDHAEVMALKQCQQLITERAILYVNLEPCCHYGRTPPCVDRIIASNIKHVVIGTTDPNPLVAGNGMKILMQHHIKTSCGILSAACETLNQYFFYFMRQHKPYVIAKWAMSLNGKTIIHHDDKTISNQAAHQHAHQQRAQVDAIVVGCNTAIQDNPRLTVRYNSHSTTTMPKRIILDSTGKTPLDLIMYTDQYTEQTIVVTTIHASISWRNQLTKQGVTVWICAVAADNQQQICLNNLIAKFTEQQYLSILIEGGDTVHQAFLSAGLVNELQIYLGNLVITHDSKKQMANIIKTEAIDTNYFITAKLDNEEIS